MVTQIKKGVHTDPGGGPMFAVPSNVGPLTIPNYESLAAQGVYTLANAGRVFAGQRDDTFYINLGAVFDTLNTRRSPLPILSDAEDADDTRNPFGDDAFSGFNVNTIALELPIAAIADKPQRAIGMYASTSAAGSVVTKDHSARDRRGRQSMSRLAPDRRVSGGR